MMSEDRRTPKMQDGSGERKIESRPKKTHIFKRYLFQ